MLLDQTGGSELPCLVIESHADLDPAIAPNRERSGLAWFFRNPRGNGAGWSHDSRNLVVCHTPLDALVIEFKATLKQLQERRQAHTHRHQ
jgi:hypothetical protein